MEVGFFHNMSNVETNGLTTLTYFSLRFIQAFSRCDLDRRLLGVDC